MRLLTTMKYNSIESFSSLEDLILFFPFSNDDDDDDEFVVVVFVICCLLYETN